AVAFAGLRSGEKEVFEDASGCRARSAERPYRPRAHVNAAVIAERRNRRPRARVDLAQSAARTENQTSVGPLRVLPIADAARRSAAGSRTFHAMRPDLLAGRGFDGHD